VLMAALQHGYGPGTARLWPRHSLGRGTAGLGQASQRPAVATVAAVAAAASGTPGGVNTRSCDMSGPRIAAMATPAYRATNERFDLDELESYRHELTAYCYRMLGSAFEAEDAVQEMMLRAVRAGHTFEGRSTPRAWLYRIATNVCLDLLRSRSRRACPVGLGPPSPPVHASLGPALPEQAWITPAADARVLCKEGDPAEIAAARETIRLAFVTALQCLPARHRAVLILCQVLRFEAAEVAEILGGTAAAVNSTLYRARATLAALPADQRPAEVSGDHAELLSRYLDAFERYDIAAFVSLLHEDAVQSMPPYAMWLRGAADIGAWMAGAGNGCRGSRLLGTRANSCPAFGQYRVDPYGGYSPFALHVREISGRRVSRLHTFLDVARIFPLFALPPRL
jgi:RNA polymerase sigma-70 factor (ECF subfamily)